MSHLQEIPAYFREVTESMAQASVRQGISLSSIRPPQKLAPLSYAVGLEVDSLISENDLLTGNIPTNSTADAFGRLILLHDPASDHPEDTGFRMVAYIQADMEADLASDPLISEVAWDWLCEELNSISTAGSSPLYKDLGGTVTSTTSARFGDIGGPPQSFQLELRASWTALAPDHHSGSSPYDLSAQVQAFAHVLAKVSGLPPEGVQSLHPLH